MDFSSAKDLMLIGMVGVICSYAGFHVKLLSDSVQTLNIQIAKILAHMESHDEKIKDHTERLGSLESQL